MRRAARGLVLIAALCGASLAGCDAGSGERGSPFRNLGKRSAAPVVVPGAPAVAACRTSAIA